MKRPIPETRCTWVPADKKLYQEYHDQEWGGGHGSLNDTNTAARDNGELLFELLCLEGQQAGLTWWTVLQKRDAYRRAFHQFVPASVAAMDTDVCVPRLLQATSTGSDRVIAHRGKLEAIVRNARAYERLTGVLVKEEAGDATHSRERAARAFADYLWRFSYLPPAATTTAALTFHPSPLLTAAGKDGALAVKKRTTATVTTETAASALMSKALKKAGFAFVGATTCYAFMQAAGMVNDHTAHCAQLIPCERWRRDLHRRDMAGLAPAMTEAQLLSVAALAGAAAVKQRVPSTRPTAGQKRKRAPDSSTKPPATRRRTTKQ